jgi:ABC-type Zn uptake system ZnuABC Zn-binding protein ZnuA
VAEGGPGYVSASAGIDLLEIPVSLSRAQGDIHVEGNPHIHTDPVNAILIARNILAGLRRVSPGNAAYFAEREVDFEKRVLEATMGADLVGILTPAAALDLLRTDKLIGFLTANRFQGQPLLDRLGGWLKTGLIFRGREMSCYHREWAYFSRRFDVRCAAYIEAKPGIPPTPKHVEEVIALMKQRSIAVLFASNYFDRNQIAQVAAKTGARAVVVPENTHGAPGIETYFDLMNAWVTGLATAFREGAT